MKYIKLKDILTKITAFSMILCMVLTMRPIVTKAEEPEAEPAPKVFETTGEYNEDGITYSTVTVNEGVELTLGEAAGLSVQNSLTVGDGGSIVGDGRLIIKGTATVSGIDLYWEDGNPVTFPIEEVNDDEWFEFRLKDEKWTRIVIWGYWSEDPGNPLYDNCTIDYEMECDIFDIGPGVTVDINEGFRVGVRENLFLQAENEGENRASIVGAGILSILATVSVEGLDLYDEEGQSTIDFPVEEAREDEWFDFMYKDGQWTRIFIWGYWSEDPGNSEFDNLDITEEYIECDIFDIGPGVTIDINADKKVGVRKSLVLHTDEEGQNGASIVGAGTLVIKGAASIAGITLYEKSGPEISFPVEDNLEGWFEFTFDENDLKWKHDDIGNQGNEPGNEPQENRSSITLNMNNPLGGEIKYIASNQAVSSWDNNGQIEVPSDADFVFWPMTVEGWRFDSISVKDSSNNPVGLTTLNELAAPESGNYIIRWDEDNDGTAIQVKCGIVNKFGEVDVNELQAVEAIPGDGTKKTATGEITCTAEDNKALGISFTPGTNPDEKKDTFIAARITRNGEIYEINDRMVTKDPSTGGWSFSIKGVSSSDSIIVDFYKQSPAETQCYKFAPEQNKAYTVTCNFSRSNQEDNNIILNFEGEKITDVKEGNQLIKIQYSADNSTWTDYYYSEENKKVESNTSNIKYLKLTWDEVLYSVGGGGFGSFKFENGVSFAVQPGVYNIHVYGEARTTMVWSTNPNTYGLDGTVTNGRVEIIKVTNSGTIVVDNNGSTDADDCENRWWTVTAENGHCQLRNGEVVTMKFIPDYGYQLKSVSIAEGVNLTPDEGTTSQFTFTMGSTNIHLKGVFTKGNDDIQTTATNVSAASIGNAGNATNSGNIRFTVTDENLTQEFSDSDAAKSVQLLDGYSMNLGLQQIVSKGTAGQYWVNDIEEFNNAITVTLNVGTELDANVDYYVIREHENQDGSFTYEKLPATYNKSTGELTFRTNKFSTYAVGTAEKSNSPIISPIITGDATDDNQKVDDGTEADGQKDADNKNEGSENISPDDKNELEIGDTAKTSKGESVTIIDTPDEEGDKGSVSYDGPKSKQKKVTIGKTTKIDGITYNVVSISANAFLKNKYIEEVSIGKNIKEIGKNAFFKCNNLEKVKLGSKVSTIGANAFYKCTSLTSIELPASVRTVSAKAFYKCKGLKEIVINSTKLTKASFGKDALKGINKNAVIYVPKGMVSKYKKFVRNAGAGEQVKVVAIKTK